MVIKLFIWSLIFDVFIATYRLSMVLNSAQQGLKKSWKSLTFHAPEPVGTLYNFTKWLTDVIRIAMDINYDKNICEGTWVRTETRIQDGVYLKISNRKWDVPSQTNSSSRCWWSVKHKITRHHISDSRLNP